MTELGKYLIAECIRTKSKTLDLGMCGLTEWPPEVCEMDWLEELNFCNYGYIAPEPGDYSNFGRGKHVFRNEDFRTQGYTLIRNHIKALPKKCVCLSVSGYKVMGRRATVGHPANQRWCNNPCRTRSPHSLIEVLLKHPPPKVKYPS